MKSPLNYNSLRNQYDSNISSPIHSNLFFENSLTQKVSSPNNKNNLSASQKDGNYSRNIFKKQYNTEEQQDYIKKLNKIEKKSNQSMLETTNMMPTMHSKSRIRLKESRKKMNNDNKIMVISG